MAARNHLEVLYVSLSLLSFPSSRYTIADVGPVPFLTYLPLGKLCAHFCRYKCSANKQRILNTQHHLWLRTTLSEVCSVQVCP